MAVDPSSSIAILNAKGDQPLQEWTDFLSQEDIGCTLSTTLGAKTAGSDPDLSCKFTEQGLWGLVFNTASNKDRFGQLNYDVGDSTNPVFLIGLQEVDKVAGTAPANPADKPATFGIIDVLQKFGVAGKAGDLPGDDGIPSSENQSTKPAANATPAKKGGLINSIVMEKLGKARPVKVDPTEHRNAVWFTPGSVLRTDVALTFVLADDGDSVVDSIVQAINRSFGLSLKSPDEKAVFKVKVQKTSSGVRTIHNDASGKSQVAGWGVTSTYRLTFELAVGSFLFSLVLQPHGLSFAITQNPDSTAIPPFLKMVGLETKLDASVFDKIVGDPRPLRVIGGKGIGGIPYWEVTIGFSWGKFEAYLDYNSRSSTFSGGLILQSFYPSDSDKLLPFYDLSQAIKAPKDYQPRLFWDIKDFSDEFKSLPSVLPTAVILANVAYDTRAKTVWFSAKLICPPPTVDTKEPQVPAPFTWDELDLSLSISRKSSDKTSFSCAMSTRFTLMAPTKDAFADLGLTMSYADGDWLLKGYAQNLTGAMLFQFFDPRIQDALTAVLGRLVIPDLQMMYTYHKDGDGNGGTATSFAFVGTVQLGKLQLRLLYQYASSKAGGKTAASISSSKNTDTSSSTRFLPEDSTVKVLVPQPTNDPKNPTAPPQVQTDWTFECDLAAAPGKDITLGEVIDSIIDGGANSFPTFLTSIPFPSDAGDLSKSPISIKVIKHVTELNSALTLFAFRVTIASFTFTFAQIGSQGTTKPKQVLRFAIDGIPSMKNIPVINTLPQPFDQLEYMWINDAGGILESEAAALNTNLLSGKQSLYYRKLVGQPADKATTSVDKVVLVPGHHFMVIHNQEAIIDHVFATSKPKIPKTLADGTKNDSGTGGADPTKVDPSKVDPSKADPAAEKSGEGSDLTIPPPASPPSKGALGFTIGPLTISALALQFKEHGDEKLISVTMEATFLMGPITFSLLGFGFEIPLSKITLKDFSSLSSLQPVLAGLALVFDKPPLLIAGGFEHNTIGTRGTKDFQEIYLGGIGIGWPPYTFIGLGEYAILEDYKSVFLYAKLDGPLVTLEFATISGVRLGFGYNSFVRPPALDELTAFPFINDNNSAGAGNNPLQIVKNMTQTQPPWVSPKQNSYWFAAGMTITAFDILTITAVAMLAFRDAGVVVSLYADAVATMPPNAPTKDVAIVYVELGLVAEMNTIDGYFRVEAALAPTSFLLVKDCHLRGGFALVYWFGSNPHAGDWVFSIGGYHPQYQKPDWYPAPQRLGVSWNPSSCMSVTGEAYFAVTPKVVMGGALIRVTLSVGPVSAWLEAGFDCLINFHPLHYRADFHVSIGVVFDMDFWFVHIHISCSVGAWLSIQGPQFGGIAHVDFYLFGFDVDFGESPAAQDPLHLIDFWLMLHQPGPAVDAQNTPAPDRLRPYLQLDQNFNSKDASPNYVEWKKDPPVEGAAFKYALEDGNFTMPERKKKKDASQPATQGGGTGNNAPSSKNPESTGAGAKWFVKGGSFKFRIATDFALSYAKVQAGDTKDDGDAVEVGDPAPADTGIYSRPMHVDNGITSKLEVKIYQTDSGHVIGGWTKGAFDIKAVPRATFGQYSRDTDPSQSDAKSLLSHDQATMPLGMGLMLAAPLPYLAESFIPVLKASDAARAAVMDFRFLKDAGDINWYLPRYQPLMVPDFWGSEKSSDPLVPVQSVYVPSELTDAEQKASLQQRWDDMGAKWAGLAKDKHDVVSDVKEGFIARIADILGWEKGLQVKLAVADATKSDGTSSGSTTAGQAAKIPQGPTSGEMKAPALAGAGNTISAGATAATQGGLPVPLTKGITPNTAAPSTNLTTTTATPTTKTVTVQGGVPTEQTPAVSTTTTTTPPTTSVPTSPRPPWQLVGTFPAKLVRSLNKKGEMVKNLEMTYLTLPRLAVVS